MNTSCGKIDLNIPDTLYGWVVKETLQIDSRDALFDYIDGGAEQFISYGYVSAVSKTYEKAGEPEVRAEVFDMASSKNAYGIFSNIRYDETDEYGQGSQYVRGALFFWKGRYYINITAIEETDETEKFIRQLAEHIQDLIPEPGEKPAILKVLPGQELDSNGILYFHHYIWLNAFYFISNDNILFIDDETDALFAKYGPADNRSFLLVVKYKNNADAEKAYENFISQYFTEDLNADVFQVKDDRWMALTTQENFIIAVFNGNTEEQVRQLVQKTTDNIKDLSCLR
ncbi:MAG TPA: DUF6599 family protein [Bacteroidales bacterium]|nr:DUF6599 family protein [Bacteroidales bacterium]